MKIQRYMTKGIQTTIPVELQFFLWELQTKLRSSQKEIDYLQIFSLSFVSKQCKTIQVIHHEAEQPKYNAVYYLELNQCVKDKIYIITDDYGDCLVETMLLASEY